MMLPRKGVNLEWTYLLKGARHELMMPTWKSVNLERTYPLAMGPSEPGSAMAATLLEFNKI